MLTATYSRNCKWVNVLGIITVSDIIKLHFVISDHIGLIWVDDHCCNELVLKLHQIAVLFYH